MNESISVCRSSATTIPNSLHSGTGLTRSTPTWTNSKKMSQYDKTEQVRELWNEHADIQCFLPLATSSTWRKHCNNCSPHVHHVPAEAEIRRWWRGRQIRPRHSIRSGCRGTDGMICLNAKFQLGKALQKYIPILSDVQLPIWHPSTAELNCYLHLSMYNILAFKAVILLEGYPVCKKSCFGNIHRFLWRPLHIWPEVLSGKHKNQAGYTEHDKGFGLQILQWKE